MEQVVRVVVELDYPIGTELQEVAEQDEHSYKAIIQRGLKLYFEKRQREHKILEKAGK